MTATPMNRIVVGTRGSTLAVRQTKLIVDLLRDRFPTIAWVIVTLRTRGDELPNRPIAELGDKGVYVRAIEHALLARDIDVAVHSLKDVPVDVETNGLVLAAFAARADPRDVLISRCGIRLKDLPTGSRIGTSSARRRMLLREVRPDLLPVEIRGNVDTRLAKLDNEEYDALLLAAAGLHRLGMSQRISQYLPVEPFIPDAGQGVLAIQTRADGGVIEMMREVDDPDSRRAVLAERALVRALEADCHSPVGAYAVIHDERLTLSAIAASEDGSQVHRLQREAIATEGESLGTSMGRALLARIGGSRGNHILRHD